MRSALAIILVCSFAAPIATSQITLNPLPTRVIGQTSLASTNFNPNLVEGRELLNPVGIALDTGTNPPGLFVADTGNNRILGFRSAVAFANGQKADIVVGQPDFATTLAQGPGGARSTGLNAPTGIATDPAGNLYIVDSGNNRILRFPKPFAQPSDQLPDFVIGQQGFTTNTANMGGVSATTLSLGTAGSVFASYLTFDASGNLWVADPGNNRILRYNASSLSSQASPGPAADVVLGQQDFLTGSYVGGATPATSLSAVQLPTGIVFDPGGRLFVSESSPSQRGRVLVWSPPFRTAQFATRILGVDMDNPQPPFVSELQLNGNTGGLFLVGNQLGIADSANNRLLLYPAFDQWTSDTLNQAATQVVGQVDFNTGKLNQGQPIAGPATLAQPTSAFFSGTELYVVDSTNHRVVVLPRAGAGFGPATRVIGQDALNLNSPNLLEGREFNFSTAGDAGLDVDLTSNPPHLYVADSYNHRILGYKDLRNLQAGQKADIVIGQPDFQHSEVNYPSNDGNKPNQSGLFLPIGLYVDPTGNLYVADLGNGRVLRFPRPFDNYKPGTPQPADLVLGQSNFFTKITDATARTMAAPYGIAQASEHGLLVSDAVHSRVLYFPGTSKTFTSGESATLVFGQKDFTSFGPGTDDNQMSAPHHIATDSDDRLYVADTRNGRVMIFDHAPTASLGAHAAILLTTGLSSPRGMHVNKITGDIWVSDAVTNTAVRFPAFNLLAVANFASNATLGAISPRAVAEDAWGNIFIADLANRVVIHYPGLATQNAASYLYPNQLAPGMIGALYSRGNFMQFGATTDVAPPYKFPLPKQLNGIQVLLNGAPVPLFFAGTDQINFEVPMGTAQSGTADLQVIEVATGRLLGDTTVGLTDAAPGLFTTVANGSGAAIAVNVDDGKPNTETNPAIAGHFITLYGTGQGFIDGAPADGDVSTKALPSARPPTVVIGPSAKSPILTGPDVQYAGLAPGLVGVWQINVRTPVDAITLPNNPVTVVILQNSHNSGLASEGRRVIIYVKQP